MATEQYQTLKARGYLNSAVVRPSGSDSYWPPEGTRVPWVLSRPVQACLDQGRELGWTNAGTIGNEAHLRKHGDHTPWSAGKIRNLLFAKDTKVPAWFEKHFLALCRMDDYDTTFIHFTNLNNKQFDYAGNYLGWSGDDHLHDSFKSSAWNKYHTLFYDAYRHYKGWPLLRGRHVKHPLAEDPDGGIIVATRDDVDVLWNTDNVVEAPKLALERNPDNRHWTPANILRAVYDSGVRQEANQAALLAALQKHEETGGGASLDELKAAAKAGAAEALSDVDITLDWSTGDQPSA